MASGRAFRTLAWTRARRDLLPSLPLEVVRIRVKRAKRLGLPYKTYATIRATTGCDIVAFLFSGNALELRPARVTCPAPVARRLAGLDGAVDRVAAVYAPMRPDAVLAANDAVLDAVARAPGFTESWTQTRDRLRGIIAAQGVPTDAVVLVSATAVEQDWCGAAGLAGRIGADAFFDHHAARS
jgi:hypothetical protein